MDAFLETVFFVCYVWKPGSFLDQGKKPQIRYARLGEKTNEHSIRQHRYRIRRMDNWRYDMVVFQ